MRKIHFFLIISFNFLYLPVKAENLTSSQVTNPDSTQIETLLEKAWELRSNDPLSAIQFAKQANAIAETNEDKVNLSQVLNYLGVIHTNMGANEIALDYHVKALASARESGDWRQIGYSYNNIGGIYSTKNKLELSTSNIFNAIKIFTEQNFNRGLAYSYLNLGRLYKDQENYKQSMNYLTSALDQIKILENEDIKAKVLLEVADLLRLQGFYTSAEKTYDELREIYLSLNQKKGLAEVWNSLSEISIEKEQFNDALFYAEKALGINEEIMNFEGEIKNLINISQIYLSINNELTAEKRLTDALNKADQLKANYLLLETYEAYYQFYKKTNDTGKALYYLELFNTLNDSLVTKEEIVRLGELESLIKIEKAQQENDKLVADLKYQTTQRNFGLAIAVLSIILVGFVSYRFYEKKKLSEELKQTNSVKDKFLKIIAHDLREPFSAIFSAVELLKDNYNEMTKEETKEFIDTIGKSVKSDFDLLENLLLWARSQSNTIQFEPELLSVCEIIDRNLDVVRTGINNKKISVSVECKDKLRVFADEQMLNTVIRNLLLNAIKFTHLDGNIHIHCRDEEKQTSIQISHSGIGMNEETLNNLFRLDKKVISKGTAGEMGSGLGLIIIEEFLKKHNGTLNIESEFGNGSKFTIRFPHKGES